MSTITRHSANDKHDVPRKIGALISSVWPSTLFTHETLELRVIDRKSGKAESQFATSLGEFSELAAKHADKDVYFGVATRFRNGGKKRDCYRVAALWCDIDGKQPHECDFSNVPDPSILISSGSGTHAYWLLDKAVPVRDAEHAELIESRNRWLAQQCDGDLNTCDVSRILRVPGRSFFNHKYKPARRVRILSNDGHRYGLEDFKTVAKPVSHVDVDLSGGKNLIHKLKSTLQDRLKSVGGGKFKDASSEDASIITSLLRLTSPQDAYATFMASARGGDVLSRKPDPVDYMRRTIAKQAAFLKKDKGKHMKAKKQDDDLFEEVDEGDEVETKLPQSVADQWQIESGKDAVSGADEEPRWIIEGMLSADGGLLCSGLPHATKSLIWLAAALQSVTTRKVWGKFPVPKSVRNVVFVETEDSRRMVKRRLRNLCRGLGLKCPPEGFHLVRPGPFALVDEGEEKLREIIEETHADLMIVSTLQGLISGRDWKEQKDMAPVNAVLVALQGKCAIVLITHSPWNEKRAAGSVTQAANFSSLMHVEKKMTEQQTITSVTLDSKETGQDSQFNLLLDIQPHDYGDGKITTQVHNVACAAVRGRPSTAAGQRQRATALKSEGRSVREIATELGLSKSAVQRLFE